MIEVIGVTSKQPIGPLAAYETSIIHFVVEADSTASQPLWEVHIGSKAVWCRDKRAHRSQKQGFYDVLKRRMKNKGLRIPTCEDQILSPNLKESIAATEKTQRKDYE